MFLIGCMCFVNKNVKIGYLPLPNQSDLRSHQPPRDVVNSGGLWLFP